jgi:hypothetical protein
MDLAHESKTLFNTTDDSPMQYEDGQKSIEPNLRKSIPITKDKSQYKPKDETQRVRTMS